VFVKMWRFFTIMLTALSMGMSFCHLLELPPRVFYFDAQLWITVTTKGLYYLFGTVGAVIEVGSVISAIVLVFLVRKRGLAFRFTLGGAILVILALVLWFVFIAPVNAELAKWTATSFPSDWTRYRNQWEYTHATNAIIKIIGMSLLLLSVLVEPPQTLASRRSHT
jgi:Domain of unknown function (DUF1772)